MERLGPLSLLCACRLCDAYLVPSAAFEASCPFSSELLNGRNSDQTEAVGRGAGVAASAGTAVLTEPVVLGREKLSASQPSPRSWTRGPCGVLSLWKLNMAGLCPNRGHAAVFVVHFSQVRTSAKRRARNTRSQMCVFGMQYFCISNSYILTHINPMICEFCQLLLCLFNQIQ